MDNRKIGIIVGASKLGKESVILKEKISQRKECGGYVIAADGGINFFREEKIIPDEWIGDMDSAGEEVRANVINELGQVKINSCSPIKDDTDTALALEILISDMKCSEVHIFGGLGGSRIEHSIANIQSMHHYKKNGVDVTLYSENSRLYVLKDEVICYDSTKTGFISVFSLSQQVKAEIKGLFYEFSGTLDNSCPLGVSNEFCGKNATIAVRDGEALIVETDK